MSTADQRRVLEEFLVRNDELEHLNSLLKQFNIFDALGVVRQEIRHSDFLAFLLNPTASHRLGDSFQKRFLQTALLGSNLTLNPVDISLWNLNGTEVMREWHNIDILLKNDEHRFVVVIENKVDSSEHSNQLQRYMDIAQREFPAHKASGLLLSPDGAPPSDERYLAISYATVCDAVDSILNLQQQLGADVRVMLSHYREMLRRHILEDSEIAELCRRIYNRHKHALDLIFEHRPDKQQFIREYLQQLVSKSHTLVEESSSKRYIHFGVKVWDTPTLLQGAGWLASGRMLVFEFENGDDLRLKLILGPGPTETRRKVFDFALANKPPFKPSFNKFYEKWNTIWVKKWLDEKELELDEREIQKLLDDRWDYFIASDLPKLMSSIESQTWLFSHVATAGQ